MTATTLAVIDYGAGNLRSVVNAFESLGVRPRVVVGPEGLAEADAVVLPGVGAFGDGMRVLRARGFVEALDEEVRKRGKPFLGICLGMQFLAEVSEENGSHQGLGWIEGRVVRLQPEDRRCKVPHMGWNTLHLRADDPLFHGLPGAPTLYFVHSYKFQPTDESCVTSFCQHGESIAATVRQGHICGVQFHPEKSQQNGIRMLLNFVEDVGFV